MGANASPPQPPAFLVPTPLQHSSLQRNAGSRHAHNVTPRRRRRKAACMAQPSPHSQPHAKPKSAKNARPQAPQAADAPSGRELWTRVKSAVPLSRVFADRLGQSALVRAGPARYKVVCPFHNDVNPSLHLDDERGTFHCFGCGASGSLIDFEQLSDGHRSVSTALRSLAARYPPIASVLSLSPPKPGAHGTPRTPPRDARGPPPVAQKPKLSRRARLTRAAVAYEVQRAASAIYAAALWNAATPAALSYLRDERKLSDPTLRAFGCGYAPPHIEGMFIHDALAAAGHPSYHVEVAGLTRRRKVPSPAAAAHDNDDDEADAATVPRDILRSRFVTPIRDPTGRPVSHAGRTLPGAPARAPKYVNGPETEIFRKSELLFGADLAKAAPSARADMGYVLVVEGYMDVMTVFERTRGRVACVATMGAAASQKQLELAYDLLQDVADGRVILNYDSDAAGIAALERLCEKVVPNMDDGAHAIYIAPPPPPVKDADEFLRVVGKEDEYIMYLLESAKPWYQWLGDRVVAAELDRMNAVEAGESATDDAASDTRNGSDGEPRQPPSPSPAEMSPEDFGFDQETLLRSAGDRDFDFLLGDYLRMQRDDLLVAYGGSGTSIERHDPTEGVIAISEPVLERLAEILVSAQKCLPGLNVGALLTSWADRLSRAKPSRLVPIYRDLLSRVERLSKPWAHLSVASQVYWMPPAQWLVDDLPEAQRKLISRATKHNRIGQDEIEGLLTDPARRKRSWEKLQYEARELMPALRTRESDSARMLKIAPRRCAEEIILRALIFAEEADRLDALAEVMEVVIRCGEKGLPFWTAMEREETFSYLATVEGPVTAEEMAAYLEEREWYCDEIEALFEGTAKETDPAWREVRALENKFPVKIAKSTALSVETMAAKVAGRLALEESGRVMEQLTNVQRGSEADEVKQLVAKEVSLRRDVDLTKFLGPDDLEQRLEMTKAAEADIEKQKIMDELMAEVEEADDIGEADDDDDDENEDDRDEDARHEEREANMRFFDDLFEDDE